MHYRIFFLFALLPFILLSCREDEPLINNQDTPFSPTPYNFVIPYRFPTQIFVPADNPMTVEGVELGRLLFYDGRLSGRTHPDSLMSCGTCHLQSNSFECGIDSNRFNLWGRPRGLTGIFTPHVMLPLINIAWNPNTFLWNGKVSRAENFTWMAIVAPHECHGDTNQVKNLFQSIPGYPPLFKKAFGTEQITIENMGRAIMQFIRTLVSADSKFDKYLRGEVQLTPQELHGFVLFTTEEGADCFHCHGGDGNPLFTTHLFYNNAKDSIFNDPRDRYSITFDPMDKGAYKATTLRNIEFTGPYMHDGRFKTLDEVINFYSDGLVWSPYVHPLMHKINDGGARLTPPEKSALKAFLLTLSDHSFINNPQFGHPASLP